MNRILSGTLILAVTFILGCSADNEEELFPEESANCDTTELTYTNDISFILNANCATSGCHEAGGQSPDYSNYTSVVANKEGIQRRAINEKTMPPLGALSNCNLNKLQAWLDNNTPE